MGTLTAAGLPDELLVHIFCSLGAEVDVGANLLAMMRTCKAALVLIEKLMPSIQARYARRCGSDSPPSSPPP